MNLVRIKGVHSMETRSKAGTLGEDGAHAIAVVWFSSVLFAGLSPKASRFILLAWFRTVTPLC